jgi:hypothetical protein
MTKEELLAARTPLSTSCHAASISLKPDPYATVAARKNDRKLKAGGKREGSHVVRSQCLPPHIGISRLTSPMASASQCPQVNSSLRSAVRNQKVKIAYWQHGRPNSWPASKSEHSVPCVCHLSVSSPIVKCRLGAVPFSVDVEWKTPRGTNKTSPGRSTVYEDAVTGWHKKIRGGFRRHISRGHTMRCQPAAAEVRAEFTVDQL